MNNQRISEKLIEIADLLAIKGSEVFKEKAYRKAAQALQETEQDVSETYRKKKIQGITEIKGIGKSIAQSIEEYIKKGKIKRLDELKQETAIRQVVTHYFQTKDISLNQLKKSARKREIIYSRYTKPAKQLIELAGSVEKAKKAVTVVADWANSRKLDYTIETVFKKWLELGRLKPKEIIKKPFYNNNPLVWSETKKKWFVIDQTNTWLEFADTEDEIEWRIIK
jgi:ribosomal protein S13